MDPVTSTSVRSESGKLESTRDTGNRPARGILGSPPSPDSSPDAPVNRPAPDKDFKKSMDKVLGATRVPAPGSENARDKTPGRDERRKPQQRPKRQEAEDEDPTQDETNDGPPDRDEDRRERTPGRTTRKGADYSRQEDGEVPDDGQDDDQVDERADDRGRDAGEDDRAEDDDHEREPRGRRPRADVMDENFARRFGIPLDSARASRVGLINDVAAILSGDSQHSNQPRNSAGQFESVQQQPGQVQQNGTGQAQADSAQRAQTDAARGQRKQLTQEGRTALVEQYGEQITPVLDELDQLRGDLQSAMQFISQTRQRETGQTVDRFFASKVMQGFGDQFGNLKKGQMSSAQRFARQELVQIATRIQVAKGNQISDDDALEAAFQYLNRDQIQTRARDEGRRQVESQVQKRHRSLDVSGATGSSPARGMGGSDQFQGQLRKFVNGGRRR